MRIKAQVGMVMNLDKCIGCHTCSVTCKNVWTNRPGAEYMWFNDVETKPGEGYPRRWEDQTQWKGGWDLDKDGRLKLRAGGKLKKLSRIFANPDMPQLDDYYEPWSYDYETLINSPAGSKQPVATPHSQVSGKSLELEWGPNWDDDLAGGFEHAARDPNREHLEEQVRLQYEEAFMMYLPRICEHCINPSCVASCPSGAMYKREEDGIVLVDQEQCRGWRMCVTGCPYKKVYFNWHTGKSEKCTLCYPRIEAGQPTVCSETCVGRIRYLGVVLYDADRVEEAASVPDEKDLYEAQLGLFCDPEDPEVRAQAARDGIPDDWIEKARRSPVYALANRFRVALPLHPEYRTMPMVWYVPPLSPVTGYAVSRTDPDSDPDDIFGAIDELRIPVDYMASMFTAGDPGPVREALRRLAAMREAMRETTLLGNGTPAADAVGRAGMSAADVEDMYRLLAIADYDDRYVIPKGHQEIGTTPIGDQGSCGLDFAGGPGPCAAGASDQESRPAAGSAATVAARDGERGEVDLFAMLERRGGKK
jgi:nitrate reductase beta subunit